MYSKSKIIFFDKNMHQKLERIEQEGRSIKKALIERAYLIRGHASAMRLDVHHEKIDASVVVSTLPVCIGSTPGPFPSAVPLSML